MRGVIGAIVFVQFLQDLLGVYFKTLFIPRYITAL